jgi:hypothetical protein
MKGAKKAKKKLKRKIINFFSLKFLFSFDWDIIMPPFFEKKRTDNLTLN